ncbi:hypothetical protein SAMN02745673_02601 [Marinactinospora thermotolerans DSM 45154]|uniref:Uncharacterized protein n=1 Tax=Marinactinospora thermotolerans DSM 45154 TaxID=1122192 RepID=A0A1T4R8Z6_9ACTN|nr:hypothetical protein SAMN02745673_02601 [Marinactinospora thermotolerans DSM 45154]
MPDPLGLPDRTAGRVQGIRHRFPAGFTEDSEGGSAPSSKVIDDLPGYPAGTSFTFSRPPPGDHRDALHLPPFRGCHAAGWWPEPVLASRLPLRCRHDPRWCRVRGCPSGLPRRARCAGRRRTRPPHRRRRRRTTWRGRGAAVRAEPARSGPGGPPGRPREPPPPHAQRAGRRPGPLDRRRAVIRGAVPPHGAHRDDRPFPQPRVRSPFAQLIRAPSPGTGMSLIPPRVAGLRHTWRAQARGQPFSGPVVSLSRTPVREHEHARRRFLRAPAGHGQRQPLRTLPQRAAQLFGGEFPRRPSPDGRPGWRGSTVISQRVSTATGHRPQRHTPCE